ncbi:hypothetical protein [Pseudomonas sp. KNUC1026]|uniref:hypothetical protein n=1 Tax=Pseudomonas sp. KNUC1026 TaxID=2893890 RepID=UPI001F2C89C8|nr:hypothetical protein [Pseudomonas sp. KNUC1026]UFH50909.1 hypothetical protein LN139_07390 [Pseudomonas sp. KNUC1026]
MRFTAFHRLAALAGAFSALAGCSDKPSDSDIQAALAGQLDGQACLTAPMFRNFPVTLSDSFSGPGPASGNAPAFDALVSAGLLTKNGASYDLTDAGRAAHQVGSQGFCYADGFEIAEVKDVSEAKGQQGPAVDQAWDVTLDIRQKPVADWAKSPAVKQLSRDPDVFTQKVHTYHVTVATVKGEKGLRLIDPRFSLNHGVSVSQGF